MAPRTPRGSPKGPKGRPRRRKAGPGMPKGRPQGRPGGPKDAQRVPQRSQGRPQEAKSGPKNVPGERRRGRKRFPRSLWGHRGHLARKDLKMCFSKGNVMKTQRFFKCFWAENAAPKSLARAALERGHPHRAQAKPLVFEASIFDGRRSGSERDCSGPPRTRTGIEG